ncbi:helix-hairpin-helix domain-containing protein [bacterium]|nr:helix-hairpin-helix domain-containing protein [bacterium]
MNKRKGGLKSVLVWIGLILMCATAADGRSVGKNPPGSRSVDINSAGVGELKTLPGIDEYRAKMIDAYRYTYGAFKSVEDIQHVPDISDEIFQQIKHRIYVDTRTMSRLGKPSPKRAPAKRRRLPQGNRAPTSPKLNTDPRKADTVYLTCGQCGSEISFPGTKIEPGTLGHDFDRCSHSWAMPPGWYRAYVGRAWNGEIVLARMGKTLAAVIFDSQTTSARGRDADFDLRWYLREDGQGPFRPDDPDVKKGRLTRNSEEYVREKEIILGPIRLGWEPGRDTLSGNLLPARDMNSKAPPVSVCFTQEADLAKVDPTAPNLQWQTRKQPGFAELRKWSRYDHGDPRKFAFFRIQCSLCRSDFKVPGKAIRLDIRSHDFKKCEHYWTGERGRRQAFRGRTKDKEVILLKHGSALGVLILDEQRTEPERGKYEWFYWSERPSGKKFLSLKDTGIVRGQGRLDPKNIHILVGDFHVWWSGSERGRGFLYPGSYRLDGTATFAVAFTGRTDIHKIDPEDHDLSWQGSIDSDPTRTPVRKMDVTEETPSPK